MNCLLDTCTLLWLAMEQTSLSDGVRDILANPKANCHVASISAFEIAQKHIKGKLKLPSPPDEWFRLCLRLHALSSLPLDHEVALKAAALPPLHSDPFDRLIIATAMEHNLILLTPDEHVRRYPGLATLW